MISRQTVAVAATACMLAVAATGTKAAVIELGAAGMVTHGEAFCGAGNAETVTLTAGGYDVQLSGGIGLVPNIFFPAGSSFAANYGSSNLGNACTVQGVGTQSGYLNPLTVQFFQAGTGILTNVSNFFIDVFNGNDEPVDYTVADNLGNTSTVNLAAVGNSGKHNFGFAAAGSIFTITAALTPGQTITWSTFINNIGFLDLLGGGIGGGGIGGGGGVGGGGGGGEVGGGGVGEGGTVPEPGTLWLASLAMLSLWGARRRRVA